MRDQDLYCPTHGLNIGRTICRFCSYGKNRENFAPTQSQAVHNSEGKMKLSEIMRQGAEILTRGQADGSVSVWLVTAENEYFDPWFILQFMPVTGSSITPNCRYGHGDLLRVTAGGQTEEWSLLANSPNIRGSAFNVALYTCTTCGYTELFDLEPAQTIRNEAQ